MSDFYSRMPKRLKIGCYPFRVELLTPEDAETVGQLGHMSSLSQTIRLRPGMTRQDLADTFIHEVLHAIHWQADLFDGNTEESFTLLTAHGLCLLWQDNPQAMKWWADLNSAGAKRG